MSFFEKIKKGIQKNKGKFIVSFILWIILAIVFVSPLTIGFTDSLKNGELNFELLFRGIYENVTKPLQSFGKMFTSTYIQMFWSVLWKFSLFYLFIVIIGIAKAMPKHEYDDIEHGSSDWCVGGEQYSVLNSKKGILLAEKHYLPVDKRGNTNVLVVGRLWFW